MKTQSKKGFTIVELVIVIAVIAILAAVLIPTFINLTKKANESADIQAVRQMNTQLAINEVTKGKSITEVHAALKSGGMDTENYTPLVEGHYFFWDSELNRVLYVDADNKVLYPEEYKNTTYQKGQRLSLNGKIGTTEVKPGNDGVYTISTAEELYWLSEQNRNKVLNAVEIKFNVAEIDLKGADIGFQFSNTDGNALACSIEGQDGGTTLYGLAQITKAYTGEVKDNQGKDYASGFVQLVEGNVALTVKNLTIANSTVGNLEIGGVGAVVGKSQAKWPVGTAVYPTITLENVTVKNSVINGKNKVGGLIGNVGSTVLTIKGCKVENVTVNCSEGQGGKAIGAIYGSKSSLTIDKKFSSWVENSTVNLVKGAVERDTKTAATDYTVNDAKIEIAAGTLLVRKYNVNKDTGALEEAKEYRMFNQNAYMSVEATNCGSDFTFTIGDKKQSVTLANCDGDSKYAEDNENKLLPCWIVTE